MADIIGGSLFNGASNWLGGQLNNITGKTASARQQYKYQLKLQHDAQNFSKWQMANAHQQEVQDLQNAGLNPVLSAGGGGASAGVSMGGASDGGSGIDPLSMIQNAVNSMNSAKMTNAQVDNIKKQNDEIQAQIEKIKAETENINQNTRINKPDTTEADIDEFLNSNWYTRPIYWAGKGLKWTSAKLGLTGRDVAQAAVAKKIIQNHNKPKTTVTNHYNNSGKLTRSTTTTSRK